MSTSHQFNPTVKADMGSQYLSLDGADAECAAVSEMLEEVDDPG